MAERQGPRAKPGQDARPPLGPDSELREKLLAGHILAFRRERSRREWSQGARGADALRLDGEMLQRPGLPAILRDIAVQENRSGLIA